MRHVCFLSQKVERVQNQKYDETMESVIMSPRIGYFAFVTYSHRHLLQVLYITNVNGLSPSQ